MDNHQPLFNRPAKSGPIAIVDPKSGQPLSVNSGSPSQPRSSKPAPPSHPYPYPYPYSPTALPFSLSNIIPTQRHTPEPWIAPNPHQGGSASPSAASPTAGTPRPGVKSPSRLAMSLQTIDLEDDGELEEAAFDVYAPSFVPEKIRIINTLPGTHFDTPSMRRIDYGAYVQGSIGWNFLESPLNNQVPPAHPPLTAETLTSETYEAFFGHHIKEEFKSQQTENESYSLYERDVEVVNPMDGTWATCTFHVAGLRENTPYIEEDDIVELRQLLYDRPGPLRGQPPGWSGMVFNGRVLNVRRSDEQIELCVDGLESRHIITHSSDVKQRTDRPGRSGYQVTLKFNIRFPVPVDRYQPMQHALSNIQRLLNMSVKSGGEVPASDAGVRVGTPDERAKDNNSWIYSMLFPKHTDCNVQKQLNTENFARPFFDKNINWEQKKAVESICLRDYGTLPFLISGPPGTGKTKTLIETALQLVKHDTATRHILLCAPSDPAADILADRLRDHFKITELLRLNRQSRTFAEVPSELLPFCYVVGNVFSIPPFPQLMAYRIIVTTCRDASILMWARMTNTDLCSSLYKLQSLIHPYSPDLPKEVELHWTALLIDEAAQAIEPDALIPLSVVAPPQGTVTLATSPLVIMAGDQHQLGPRTSLPSSPLKTSLFSRLFSRPVYANHPLARGNEGRQPPPLTKSMLPMYRPAFANLIRNYRSHPAILAVPSHLFYADTLVPEARDVHRMLPWSAWKGKRWPVLFHNNPSRDELEREGGGWYNDGEARIACDYAASIVDSGLVEPREVCIMSPFKAQVRRIRQLIRGMGKDALWGVNIGPTEAFQGLEKGVVILCTTRSKQRFVERDRALAWGIIGMPNSMNVAITRAKYGLVVVGKEELLRADPYWRAFVAFCDRNGLVDGARDAGARLDNDNNNGNVPDTTRLEKTLLAKERSLEEQAAARALRGAETDDDMWRSGMRFLQSAGLDSLID
ncbi:P-loop containing nucleoside triphosphate hydrolase protein [Biscogniauxia mediterranea]|nr:P-loop containing nucleoside triphosphate hydrolase protein [Biscogniauxia mediterranea]